MRLFIGYLKEGNDVIIDYILYNPSWYDDFQKKLKNIEYYWVKVDISLEELKGREKSRGISPCGDARSHYDTV